MVKSERRHQQEATKKVAMFENEAFCFNPDD